MGLDLLVHGDKELPVVEGAGCFEVIYFELGQSWTLGRAADCTAHVAELAALSDGGYLVVLRTVDVVLADQPGAYAEFYPFILHADGTIEALPPIDRTDRPSDTRVDVQPGPGRAHRPHRRRDHGDDRARLDPVTAARDRRQSRILRQRSVQNSA